MGQNRAPHCILGGSLHLLLRWDAAPDILLTGRLIPEEPALCSSVCSSLWEGPGRLAPGQRELAGESPQMRGLHSPAVTCCSLCPRTGHRCRLPPHLPTEASTFFGHSLPWAVAKSSPSLGDPLAGFCPRRRWNEGTSLLPPYWSLLVHPPGRGPLWTADHLCPVRFRGPAPHH